MNTGDYLCEELMDDVNRNDTPIYRALIDLRRLVTIGSISKAQDLICRRKLANLAEQRMAKD